jgi:hypothetical protein
LLELKKLGEVTKYSSSSSLLVVKLISVERRDSTFLFFDAAFNYVNFFENKSQGLLSWNSIGFKMNLFLCLALAIAQQSAVL